MRYIKTVTIWNAVATVTSNTFTILIFFQIYVQNGTIEAIRRFRPTVSYALRLYL